MRNQVIASPVALFEIPADRGQMTLTITSEISDSVFYPHVMIVDAQGQVVESYEEVTFEYRKPRLHLGNRLVAELISIHRKVTNRCLFWFTPNSKT